MIAYQKVSLWRQEAHLFRHSQIVLQIRDLQGNCYFCVYLSYVIVVFFIIIIPSLQKYLNSMDLPSTRNTQPSGPVCHVTWFSYMCVCVCVTQSQSGAGSNYNKEVTLHSSVFLNWSLTTGCNFVSYLIQMNNSFDSVTLKYFRLEVQGGTSFNFFLCWFSFVCMIFEGWDLCCLIWHFCWSVPKISLHPPPVKARLMSLDQT